MNFTVTEFNVPSTDGIHTLSGVMYVPNGEIKGLFHLVHGMTEYIGRYDHVLSFLARNGYVAFGYDHLGHGKTVANKQELGFIADKKGYKLLVDDVVVFEDEIIKLYPDKKLILMGHSMGSFIARIAASRVKDRFSGLIVCGTGGPQPLTPLGLAICKIMGVVFGKHHISPLVEALTFGAYNKRFEGKSKYDWLTKDRELIENYEKDELCNYHFTVCALYDLVKLNSLSNKKTAYRVPEKLPILVISGEMDPVGNYGKGVKTVYERYKKAGVTDVKLKLYPDCRHEIHNDSCKEQMFKDLLDFSEINTKI